MGSVTAYETNAGKRYRVIYRKPDHIQTQKRGFKTKRDAELFLAKVEIDKSRGAYVDPAKSRVLLGEWLDAWMASRSDWRETSRARSRNRCATYQARAGWIPTRRAKPPAHPELGRGPV